MDIFSILAISAIVFGAIVGSFLNALLFRYGTGKSVMRGRSQCVHCGHTLAALDLVPIFSYIFLRGKCRYCGTNVSMQYPLVEIVGAMLSLGIFLQYPQPLFYAFWLLVWMTILFLIVYDIRHTVLPWSCTLLLIALSLAYVGFTHQDMWGWLAGPILAAPLAFLSLVSRGRWMGWGDGVLELSLGWFLGVSAGVTALLLAVWIGATVGIALVILPKILAKIRRKVFAMLSYQDQWKLRGYGFTMSSEIPFAPFMAMGAALVFFFHVDFPSIFFAVW